MGEKEKPMDLQNSRYIKQMQFTDSEKTQYLKDYACTCEI